MATAAPAPAPAPTTGRARPGPPAPAPAERGRLPRPARRAVLVVHVLAAGAWVGIDVVLGVLVVTALVTGDPATEALCLQVLELVAVWPLLTAGLVTLASGVVLGLGTRWGLVRYRWVAVKLALNLVLVALTALALRPGLAEAARHGAELAVGATPRSDVGFLFFPPLVSGAALAFATALSVVKPWGRLRRR